MIPITRRVVAGAHSDPTIPITRRVVAGAHSAPTIPITRRVVAGDLSDLTIPITRRAAAGAPSMREVRAVPAVLRSKPRLCQPGRSQGARHRGSR